MFLYGSAGRGFKSGGYNGGGGSVIGISTPFGAEKVTSYEVGAKTEWLERRLRLNSALYFSQYTDLQGAVIVPGTLNIITENAIDLDNYGLELELTAAATDRLQVFAMLGFNYTVPVAGSGGRFSFGADYNYRDRFYSSPDNNIYSEASAQSRVNAFLGYASADQRWTLRLEGRNLTDEVDWVNGLDLVSFLGAAIRHTLEPRVRAVSARYRID